MISYIPKLEEINKDIFNKKAKEITKAAIKWRGMINNNKYE